jgi:hypothetical protein
MKLKNAAATPRFLLAERLLPGQVSYPSPQCSEAIQKLSAATFWIASLRSQ